MAANNVLLQIKNRLDPLVGKKIRVKANKGRKKVIEREGILEKTYPHIFVIRIDEKELPYRRVSYSYSDVLTESVKLVVCNDVPQKESG